MRRSIDTGSSLPIGKSCRRRPGVRAAARSSLIGDVRSRCAAAWLRVPVACGLLGDVLMPTPDLLVSRSLLTGALAASLLTACASDLSCPPSIIDGAPDYEHTSVVRISWGDGIHTGSTCSGTYIGAGRVLTALHCVPSDSSETISVTFVNYHDTYGDSAQVETEAHDETPPDPSGDGLARVVVSDSDVAALPFAVPPMSILPASAAPLSHGDRFTAIGFGATTAPTAAAPLGAGYDTRHKGQVSLSEFTGEMVRVVDGPDGAAPCNGDSGGPLVVTRVASTIWSASC
jgi:hypothetical protein